RPPRRAGAPGSPSSAATTRPPPPARSSRSRPTRATSAAAPRASPSASPDAHLPIAWPSLRRRRARARSRSTPARRRRSASSCPIRSCTRRARSIAERVAGEGTSLAALGSMRRGRLLVGTSGWLYPHWRDRFYPPRLPLKQQLPYLASQLPSVEINGTFYSLKRPPSFAAWRDGTPDDFVFAVKGSRYLTHMLKLREPRAPLANFFAQGVLLLGKKLGPILWQLPPMLGFDADRARAFFDLLPRDLAAAERLARRHDHRLDGRSALTAPDGHDRPLRHALEVRHSSWLDEPALTLLAEHGIAL